jgi:hypothetical protein
MPGHPGEHRLVGYLAGAGMPSPVQLHRAFVAALNGRDGLQAPHWYRCVETVDDPGDVQAWQRATVLTEGDGRGHP